MQSQLFVKILLCSAVVFSVFTVSAQSQDSSWTKSVHIINTDIDNFYQIDTWVYRSEQPSRVGMQTLQTMDVRSILNLREYHNDEREARNTNLKLYHLRWSAGSITEKDLLESMQIIQSAPKPILVHCWHGSDRTGAVIAAYRIVYHHWSVERALDEMVNGPFGHHAKLYPNIQKLFRSISWDEFKKSCPPMPSSDSERG